MQSRKLQGKRIFYVEDDLNNRAVVQMILELEGAIVSFERWGREETIAKIKAFMPVDIILLDLMLPKGVSGYDVYDHIQADADLNGIPVVAVSASDPAVEIPHARDKGLAGYISKPVNLHTFPEFIETVLQGEPVWA